MMASPVTAREGRRIMKKAIGEVMSLFSIDDIKPYDSGQNTPKKGDNCCKSSKRVLARKIMQGAPLNEDDKAMAKLAKTEL